MADLHTLEHAYFELSRQFDPVSATAEGLTTYDTRYGRYDDAAIKPFIEKTVAIGRALRSVPVASPDEQIDRLALYNDVMSSLYSYEHDKQQIKNPDFWLNHLFEGLRLFLSESDRKLDERVRGLVGRLNDAPGFLANASNVINDPPKTFVSTAMEVSDSGRNLLRQVETFAQLVPDHQKVLVAGVKRCEQALSSFDSDLKEWNRTLLNNFAIGEESFAFHLRYDHGLKDSPNEILQYGLKLKKHCEQNLIQIAQKLGKTNDWKKLIEQYREKHPKRAELVAAYKHHMERAKAFLEKKDIITLSNVPLIVEPTPDFHRITTPFASYEEPALFSKKKKGIFSVTLPDPKLPDAKQMQLIKDHCVYEIPVTAVHEGYPGHHLQLTIAQSLPSETRKLHSTPLSLEGWALYCEGMMGEQLFYQEPQEEFFVWMHLLWRALRVILDVQLHCKGMLPSTAVNYMMENLVLSSENAQSEVKRYCAEPTTQLCYAVGRREIRELREDFGHKYGSSLKKFHDTLMSYGGLPVSLARRGMGLMK